MSNSLGGTISVVGLYRIHTFSTVGTSTFVPSASGFVELLVVAGGGGTGFDVGGGGGGGGVCYSVSYPVRSTPFFISDGRCKRISPSTSSSVMAVLVANH